MNKQQKELVVKTLRDDFQNSQASFLVGVKGLTVKQTQALRSSLRKGGAQLKVAKVRLVKRAMLDTATGEALNPFLKEQVAVVFAQHNSPAIAKTLHDFSKDNASLRLIAGYVDSQVLDANAVKYVATLPSKEVLLAQLCGVLQAPIAGLVGVLNANLVQLLQTLDQIEKQKQQ